MLIVGDWVVPVSSPPIAGGAVLVRDTEIAAVGPAAELRARYPDEEVSEHPGCALLPGLINAHTHLDYSAFLGIRRSGGFMRWIIRLTRARMRLDSEDLAASALWGAHECLRQGVTSIADTSFGGSTVALAARAAGLRARVYLEVFGLDDDRLPETLERLETALARARAASGANRAGDADGAGGGHGFEDRVEWGVSPHATYTVSQPLYREVARFARRSGLRMATHVAESKTEVRLSNGGAGLATLVYGAASLLTGGRWRLPSKRPLQYVAETGALGTDMLVVHAVQMDGADIKTLAASGAPVAHCPRSNENLGCGIAPVAAMKAAGVVVALGTDSLASNDGLDMLAEMRAALEASHSRAQKADTEALLPSEILRMATLDGARALGWEARAGSLEVGKRADITVVSLPGTVSSSTSPEDLALAVMQGQVRMTVAEGRVAYAGEATPAEVSASFAAVRMKLGLKD